MKRLVLIDGKSVFYRGYYAMGALSLADGTPTGGVYGFAAIAMEIVSKLAPTKVVVAWDSPTSVTRRREIFAEYKAGRVKPGEDFYAQIPLLKELVADLGWDFVEIDEYEADDIIGTLSLQADEVIGPDGKCEWETYIISSDLDMLQIVDENTRMWRVLKGFTKIEEIDVAEFEEKYGIRQAQFLDLKALKGDASDNIPGVPGVGEKTAVKLLNDYGDLDGVYEHIDEISGALHDKLVAGKESAYMSRDLARIMLDAPVKLSDLPDFEFDLPKVVAGLKKLEFNSLIRKVNQFKSEDHSSSGALRGASPSLTPSEKWSSDLSNNLSGARSQNLQLTPRGDSRVMPILDSVDPSREIAILNSPDYDIIEWDVKGRMHDDKELARRVLLGEKFWDVAQAKFLLNPLARDDGQIPLDLKGEYEEQRKEFSRLPKLYKVYTELDLPLIPVLYKMEEKGMLIERGYFEKLREEYSTEVKELEQKIYTLAGVEFNVNSPVQLSEVLFSRLALPTKGVKKTTRGYSTGVKELLKLKDAHPVIPKIMEYREAAKLLNTYITPMPELADKEGRIHTSFTQNVTATGRLSSHNPNLQNIPVRTEEGKRIRAGFVAGPGKVLVSADYSQFELRLAAVLSGDEPLINDFNNGLDIHTKIAAEAFGVPMDEVSKEQRRAAKVINFGVLYGMSVQGLSEAAGMPFYEAKKFIENYFKLRAPIKKYLDKILKQAREEGFVETFYGRRRPTPDVKSSNFVIRQAAERAAANMPIQGTEADLMKKAMISVDSVLPAGAELVMQVHDSLIVECDEGLADEVSGILREEMEGVAPELPIKLAVEVSTGKNWGEI